MPAHITDAPRLACPNPACAAPHVVRNGTINGRQRYHCRGCGAWFGETQGTPLYRLRTQSAEIARALLAVLRRGSLRAAEEQTGHKYETISHWLRLAAAHAEAVSDVLARDLDLSTAEVDEFWSFVRRRSATSPRPTHRRWGTAGRA
jgi:transposase-like protein